MNNSETRMVFSRPEASFDSCIDAMDKLGKSINKNMATATQRMRRMVGPWAVST